MYKTANKMSRAMEEGYMVRMGGYATGVKCYENIDCGSRLVGGFLGHWFREIWREGRGEERGNLDLVPCCGHGVWEFAAGSMLASCRK